MCVCFGKLLPFYTYTEIRFVYTNVLCVNVLKNRKENLRRKQNVKEKQQQKEQQKQITYQGCNMQYFTKSNKSDSNMDYNRI